MSDQPKISAAQWLRVLVHSGVLLKTATVWASVFEAWVQPDHFSAGRRELDDFTGQMLYETQLLEHLEENLEYSAQRLCEVWPTRFQSLADAAPYAYHPEALANKVYGGRMGNSHEGDGWRYRGRGIPMITGFNNYALIAKLTGLPLLETPELLSTPVGAMHCGILWWEKRVPDSALGSVERVTQAVQGAALGLKARAMLTNKVMAALVEVQGPVSATDERQA
jgi:putative chitinase